MKVSGKRTFLLSKISLASIYSGIDEVLFANSQLPILIVRHLSLALNTLVKILRVVLQVM